MSDVADMSEAIELAVLRERVKNLEELADHHRGQLKDPEWWHQQAMEQRGASQRTVDALTLNPPGRGHPDSNPARRAIVPQVAAGIVNTLIDPCPLRPQPIYGESVEQRATASMTEKGQFRPVVVSCKVRLLGAPPDTTPVRKTGLLTAGRNPGDRTDPVRQPLTAEGNNVTSQG